jgi:hypothetical protein
VRMHDKHTPGPWRVHRDLNVESVTNKRGVATCGGHQNSSNSEAVDAENKANAHLIAAAPDMLVVCQDIVGAVFDSEFVRVQEMAREAIAKARGDE